MHRPLALALAMTPTSALAATLQVGPAQPYATITEAVDAAASGDTIEVDPGVYAENVQTSGKDLVIVGVGGSAATSIEGPSGTGVLVSGSVVTLQGFSVSSLNKGISVGAGATFTGIDLVISDMEAGYYSDNGVALISGFSDVSLTDCVFERNRSVYSHGSTVDLHDGTATLVRVRFSDNVADGDGALYLASNDTTLEDCTFERNTSQDGGAVWVRNGTLTVTGGSFVDNVAGGRGGAMSVFGATAVSSLGATFCGNTAGTDGGAVALQRAGSTTHTWTENLFVDNDAAGSGGGLFVQEVGALQVQDNTFVGNSAALGGHLDAADSAPDLVNNLFVSATGNGITQTDASGTRDYNLYFDNTAADAGGGLVAADLGPNSVFADPWLVSYSDDGDCTNDDLQLLSSSPAIDAGDPSLLDLDGSPSDIGALGVSDISVDVDEDGYEAGVDCDDSDPLVNPDATESCNDIDDDCDDEIDEGLSQTWYADDDDDGYGLSDDTAEECAQPSGYAAADGDCDDTDAGVNPGATDLADDGIDQDCDGVDAEGTEPTDGGTDEATDEPKEGGGCGCSMRTAPAASLWAALALVRRR